MVAHCHTRLLTQRHVAEVKNACTPPADGKDSFRALAPLWPRHPQVAAHTVAVFETCKWCLHGHAASSHAVYLETILVFMSRSTDENEQRFFIPGQMFGTMQLFSRAGLYGPGSGAVATHACSCAGTRRHNGLRNKSTRTQAGIVVGHIKCKCTHGETGQLQGVCCPALPAGFGPRTCSGPLHTCPLASMHGTALSFCSTSHHFSKDTTESLSLLCAVSAPPCDVRQCRTAQTIGQHAHACHTAVRAAAVLWLSCIHAAPVCRHPHTSRR